ncbi:BNR repeat-containing protein [Flavobacterium sp.]|uniref:BNR repeat-containing protein n=1 Tax=Flavobacterium sp. TaxID=239 RepID=UPI0025C4F2B8|nr:BNR repeat-containing protein [Flavobacterium sp.]
MKSLFRNIVLLVVFAFADANGQKARERFVGNGWARNTVNTVIFRSDAVVSDKNWQFTAFYDKDANVVVAKRKLNSDEWETKKTRFIGKAQDAHNSISIALDGAGFLHLSFDHHDSKLRYAVSKKRYGLDFSDEVPMVGNDENKVTYPEFHKLENGNLLFLYRSGASGRGNLVLNKYDLKTRKWTRIHENLVDGQNQRSAYWQTCTSGGKIYISWTWRETYDVSTNHDLCFAMSDDEGKTWKKSSGETYQLPITEASAEKIWNIPQNSSLINQTAMTVDESGNPYIATYWKTGEIPQYKVVYLNDGKWQMSDSGFRKTPFDLGGGGTKRIPVSRPKLLVDSNKMYLIFRDEERGNKLSIAQSQKPFATWTVSDISDEDLAQWEPNYDRNLWKTKKQLHIFAQKTTQIDGEGLLETSELPVKIIEITFPKSH